MSQAVETLLNTVDGKAFAAQMKKIQEEFETGLSFLKAVSSYLPTRLYHRFYDDTVPGSFLGLMGALRWEALLPEELRWRLYAQQAYHAARERKRLPWNLSEIATKTEGDLDSRLEAFRESCRQSNPAEAMAWAKGMLNEPDRKAFRESSLAFALSDFGFDGQKFLYLYLSWQLAEKLSWESVPEILFPAIHLLALGPKRWDESRLAGQKSESFQPPEEGTVNDAALAAAERSILFSPDVSSAMDAVVNLASQGAGWKSINESLSLIAMQALSNAKVGSWTPPMRAFLTASFLSEWLQGSDQHRSIALLNSAALIWRASNSSREADENRRLDELADRLCPTSPIDTLKSLVSHTDPYGSATVIHGILGMEEARLSDFFQALITLATKNDASVCSGSDILCVGESVKGFQNGSLPNRGNLLIGSGFFLARVPKDYTFAGHFGMK